VEKTRQSSNCEQLRQLQEKEFPEARRFPCFEQFSGGSRGLQAPEKQQFNNEAPLGTALHPSYFYPIQADNFDIDATAFFPEGRHENSPGWNPGKAHRSRFRVP
jgi:hypothetical protein